MRRAKAFSASSRYKPRPRPIPLPKLLRRGISRYINTQGGDYAQGNIDKRTIITDELAYRVAGLPNPYLGLRAFSAQEQNIFAGRERIVQALAERLSGQQSDRLLLIVGASGSGKSSLVRAGVLPQLAKRLNAQGQLVHQQIIDHPGDQAQALAALLAQLCAQTPTETRVALLLVDQFEEIFSLAECSTILDLLADLIERRELGLRVILTLRSDFLPRLLEDARFDLIERHKVVLRAMSPDELTDAIQRPIQVYYPNKRMEPALLQRLATDTAADAAYLPLLQVTLEDLWRGGELRLGKYQGIGDAIQRRADTVYTYRDYNDLQQERRSPEEQGQLLSLMLDLVRVSLDTNQIDTRWRRPYAELTHGSAARATLIADLTDARLLRTDYEPGQDERTNTVDIVHESLLTSWPTLREAINEQREYLRQRSRFDLALSEWQNHAQQEAYLLMGVRLAEAEGLRQRGDSIFQRTSADEFYLRSQELQQHEQQRTLAQTQALLRAERYGRRLAQGVVLILSIVVLILIYLPARSTWLWYQARATGLIRIAPMQLAVEPSEVTIQRYRLCMDADRCTEPDFALINQEAQLPVTGVDAFQAAAFCEWIGRRLPSLGEWQRVVASQQSAATAEQWAAMQASANLFTGSFDSAALREVATSGSTTPAGIHDLLGNAAEWTISLDPESQQLWDGQQIDDRTLYVAGGSYETPNEPAGYRPVDSEADLGFRCVAD